MAKEGITRGPGGVRRKTEDARGSGRAKGSGGGGGSKGGGDRGGGSKSGRTGNR